MSSHVGASGVFGSSRVGENGTDDAGEEDSNRETDTLHLRVGKPRRRNANPVGEERSSSVEQLVRPALPGRKAHRKTCSEDNRRRWTEGNQDRDEERQRVEHVGGRGNGRERGKQRPRKTERTETHGDGARDREVGGSMDSLSSSNSDIHLNSTMEVAEGSNSLQRGHLCPKPHSTVCSRISTAQSPRPAVRTVSPALPQPPIQTRSTPLSPQRLSSRTAVGDLHHSPPSSSRDPDPFWAEVRTGAGIARSSQIHRCQTHIPPLTSLELGEEEEEEVEEEEEEEVDDGEEGGSGVMEVTNQTLTPAVLLPSLPYGERRISKREKNRIRCLRRRQRRKERWRQSQLQESRQVNDTIT